MTKIYNNVLETIGKTPLVKLNKLTQGTNATVVAKLESRNPGGSVKDRICLSMISRSRKTRLNQTRRNHHRADKRQHRHRLSHGSSRKRLQTNTHNARNHEHRTPQSTQSLRRTTRPHARTRRHGRRHQKSRRTSRTNTQTASCPSNSKT